MRRVILESPYSGDVERNLRYARACLRDCLLRGESPLASHLLYTQGGVLDDLVPAERELGISAGHEWTPSADAVVMYVDLGESRGMALGEAAAARAGVPVERRRLRGEWWDQW